LPLASRRLCKKKIGILKKLRIVSTCFVVFTPNPLRGLKSALKQRNGAIFTVQKSPLGDLGVEKKGILSIRKFNFLKISFLHNLLGEGLG
jgi:hypothetical protein